ncbi:NADPH-dependent FMN reductase [Mycolicibacter longobardus]|uniref:FMN reductase n=1 Tax=Mycolicibacter longobardus TaxID=1108812 RepID=A0A1X1Y854_9MYCO|nr:NAD(P)H-dependent oxidoreductase [Mycolicibacter longobardus]MCV7384665.1 NAD(P)H-dependent oxidoreductase [Mycolicibacter longobardus]ORW07245.1 FMN reductase [Mycolicibacter longobardus]
MTQETSTVRLLILLGSLRSGSLNRQLAQTAIAHAPARVAPILFDRLNEVPHYNEDIDVPPGDAAVQALRAEVDNCDALLVVTPEYNGGLPGVLKNAIDWLSRPYGSSALKGKPTAVIGSSLGRHGGAWAHADARKSLAIAGARVLDGIELSIPAKSLNGLRPDESPEVIESLRAVWSQLVLSVVI